MKAAQAIKNFNCKNLYTSLTGPPHNKTHKTKSCPCKTRALQMKTLLYAAGVLFFKPRMGGLVKLLPSRSMRTIEATRLWELNIKAATSPISNSSSTSNRQQSFNLIPFRLNAPLFGYFVS